MSLSSQMLNDEQLSQTQRDGRRRDIRVKSLHKNSSNGFDEL